MLNDFFTYFAYIHALNPFIIQFTDNIGIRWYGLAYIIGVLAGIFYYHYLAKKGYSELPSEKITDFFTMGTFFGIILGGRIGYILLYDFNHFLHDPKSIFYIWEGGMSSHGGIIGVILWTIWYAWYHGYSAYNLGDNICVVAPIGIFFGRCANFINGELYGRITDSIGGIIFPKEIYTYTPDRLRDLLYKTSSVYPGFNTPQQIISGVSSSPELCKLLEQELPTRYPSQLLEACLEGLILFIILAIARKKRFPDGYLSSIFFIAYPCLRIIGELFREPDASPIFGFTRGEFFSLFMLICGFYLFITAKKYQHFAPIWQNQE